jgi:hypothetical protein
MPRTPGAKNKKPAKAAVKRAKAAVKRAKLTIDEPTPIEKTNTLPELEDDNWWKEKLRERCFDKVVDLHKGTQTTLTGLIAEAQELFDYIKGLGKMHAPESLEVLKEYVNPAVHEPKLSAIKQQLDKIDGPDIPFRSRFEETHTL